MAMPIMVPVSVKSVPSKKHAGSSRGASARGSRERIVIYEGSSGPRELLEAIVIQSQAALKGLEGAKSATEEHEEEMTEEQKRMTRDDKGKGKEAEPIQSPENLKLLQFWYVGYCPECLNDLNMIVLLCIVNVSSRRLKRSTDHYAKPRAMHLLCVCMHLCPKFLRQLLVHEDTTRSRPERQTKRRVKYT